MYQYVPGDHSIVLLTYNADMSTTTQAKTYRLKDGLYTSVDLYTYQGGSPSIQNTKMDIDHARVSLYQGKPFSGYPDVMAPDGSYSTGEGLLVGLRYLVASGETTLAKVEALLAKCSMTISPAQFLSSLPDVLPAGLTEASFNGVYINALVGVQKTIGNLNDSALMATLPQGGSMPWSIPSGSTAAQTAVADWKGYAPVLFTVGNAPVSNVILTDSLAKAEKVISGGETATPYPVTNSPYVENIQKVYIAYFNRPADAEGLNYWANYMEANNGDVTKLMAAFAPSAEYKSFYDGKTTSQLIDAVYINLFARPAEPLGAAYWANKIDIGEVSVASASYSILNGAQGDDRVIVANKTSVAKAFTESMNDSAKVAAFTNWDATAAARKMLNNVTADTASIAKVKASIMDTLKTVGISGSVSGDVINLNHAGRDANIVVFAPTQTLKTATINGFSGSDKIDLSDFAFTGTMAGVVNKTAFQTTADAGFFGGKGAVLAESGGTTHVYVDANKDGGYTPGTDFDITITGVSAVAVNLIF